jgi:Fe-S cluster biogenesis protein NfuA
MIEDIPEAERTIEKILEFARPYLQIDGGDVALLNVGKDDIVQLRFLGACATCPMIWMTYQAGFERLIREHYPDARVIMMND